MCTCLLTLEIKLIKAINDKEEPSDSYVSGLKLLNTQAYNVLGRAQSRPVLEVAYSLRKHGRGGAAQKERKVVDFNFCPFCGKPYNPDSGAADRGETTY